MYLLSFLLAVAVVYFIHRSHRLEEQVKELEKRVERIDSRLKRVEELSVEDPKLLLTKADSYIGKMRNGSSQIELERKALEALRQACEKADTPYWLTLVGRKLKKFKKFVKSQDRPDGDLLRQINEMTDRYDIELDKV